MIAIKGMGMEMPKNCANCSFSIYYENLGGYVCEYVGEVINKNEILKKRLDNCPLVEIVTCKDCKYARQSEDNDRYCYLSGKYHDIDYFCANAERKE